MNRIANRFLNRWIIAGASLFASSIGSAQSPDLEIADQARVVIKKHCITCHGESQARGDLDMSSLEKIMAGSASGNVVVPGKPEESLVYVLAAHQDNPKMPPNAPRISQRELGILFKWIAKLPNPSSEAESNSGSMKMSGSEADAPASKKDRSEVSKVNSSSIDKVPLDRGLIDARPMPGRTSITALSANADFTMAAVSGLHQVLLLDLKTQKWLGGLEFPEGDVFAIQFSRDGKRLFAAGGKGGSSGAVVGWDLSSYRRIGEISLDRDAVLAMDVSPDGKWIAVGGPTRTLQILQVSNGIEKHREIKKHTDWITSIAFSHDGLLLASGDRFGGIYLWESQSGKEFASLKGHTGLISTIDWSDDSNRLLTSGRDGRLQLYDLTQEEVSANWFAHQDGAEAHFGAGDQIVSCGQDRTLALWSGSEKRTAEQKLDAYFTKLCLSSDGQLAIAGDTVGTIHLFNGFPSKKRNQEESKGLLIPLPVQQQDQTLKAFQNLAAAFRPKVVDRSSTPLKGMELPSKGQVAVNHKSVSAGDNPSPLPMNSEADLKETQRALEDSQNALKQAYQTVQLLEESVARLKQVVAIQEARVNQSKLQQRSTQGVAK